MNSLTFKQVYDALCRKIKETYPDKNRYGSNIHQNLDEGSFNIIPISATGTGELDTRIKRKVTFDCLYYSEDYEELLGIADGLPLAIEIIKTEDGQILHGSFNTPTTEMADGVLHCIVSYEYFGLITEVIPEGEEGETDLMYYLEQIITEVNN